MKWGEHYLVMQSSFPFVGNFNVNEAWLRTCEGEMFIELTRNEEIAAFISKTLADEDATFQKRLISALSALDESEWKILEKIAKNLVNKME